MRKIASRTSGDDLGMVILKAFATVPQ